MILFSAKLWDKYFIRLDQWFPAHPRPTPLLPLWTSSFSQRDSNGVLNSAFLTVADQKSNSSSSITKFFQEVSDRGHQILVAMIGYLRSRLYWRCHVRIGPRYCRIFSREQFATKLQTRTKQPQWWRWTLESSTGCKIFSPRTFPHDQSLPQVQVCSHFFVPLHRISDLEPRASNFQRDFCILGAFLVSIPPTMYCMYRGLPFTAFEALQKNIPWLSGFRLDNISIRKLTFLEEKKDLEAASHHTTWQSWSLKTLGSSSVIKNLTMSSKPFSGIVNPSLQMLGCKANARLTCNVDKQVLP